MRCGQCRAELKTSVNKKGTELMPRGAKRLGEVVYCKKCWKELYVLRAITIPVRGPLGSTWQELRESLKSAWSMSTAATNAAMSFTFAHDEHRKPGIEKMPPKPTTYTYPVIRAAVPDMPTASVVCIANAVEQKYRAKRYEIVWTGVSSLPSARYPQPYPIRAGDWKASMSPAGKGENSDVVPCLSVPLPGGRFLLQLQGGREYARQLRDFGLIASGEAVPCEMQIIEQKVGGRVRNGTTAREGGQRTSARVMAKLVAYFPRRPKSQRAGVLFVSRSVDAFLFAINAKDDRLFTINADHLPRIIAEHRRQLQRWSDDSKMEPRRQRHLPWAAKRERACRKYHARMTAAVKQYAAQVVSYADRRGFAEIHWLPNETCIPDFTWFAFVTRMQVLCDEAGIAFSAKEVASGEVESKTHEVLATHT